MKNWSRIVESYPGNHMGPTLPFLFGAMQEPVGEAPATEAAASAALRELLDALSDAPEHHGVRIQRCDTIHEYVVAQHPFTSGLSWDEIDGVKPATLDELVALLWARYGRMIMAGEFSFTDGEWHRLWPGEMGRIESTLRGN